MSSWSDRMGNVRMWATTWARGGKRRPPSPAKPPPPPPVADREREAENIERRARHLEWRARHAESARRRLAQDDVGRESPEVVRVRLESAGGLLSSDPEMGLLMLHEMVMRKQRLPANATEYVRWAHSIDHPLAVLPLQLLSIEDDVPARMPRYRSTGGSLPWPATPDPTSMVPLPELLRSVGDAAPIDVELALTAVDDWMGAEVRRFARGELPGLTELDDRATGAEWIALSTERCDWFDQIVDVWLIAVTDEHVTIIAASDSD